MRSARSSIVAPGDTLTGGARGRTRGVMTDQANTPNEQPAARRYPIDQRTGAQIADAFGFAMPNPDQGARIDGIRTRCRELAIEIASTAPPGRHLSMALTALEEAATWAVKAIANER